VLAGCLAEKQEATMTTKQLAQRLEDLTPRLQVAVLREALTVLRPQERAARVEDLTGALERAGYAVAARRLRQAPTHVSRS
jgi:hypothetical protein